ncbi:MAG: FimV/HubP family polar landmark protein, partial [Chromatocurvus sp.]
PEKTPASATPAPGQSGGDADVTELELDFDELAIEDDEPAAAAVIEEDELDLSEALREAEAPEEQRAEEPGSDERDSEDMMFASDSDQVATRLDLARAYIDMGDDEGARRILEQVVTVGTEEQQREAQALLDRIG